MANHEHDCEDGTVTPFEEQGPQTSFTASQVDHTVACALTTTSNSILQIGTVRNILPQPSGDITEIKTKSKTVLLGLSRLRALEMEHVDPIHYLVREGDPSGCSREQ